MYVHRSNSADALVDALGRVVGQPLGTPMDPECIVVQGRGMERWLSAQLARRLGVWANPSFPFPRAIIDRAFHRVLGDEIPEGTVFQPGALLWAIAKILGDHLSSPAFTVLRTYLQGDQDRRMRIALAHRIAETFDGYAVYRPEMVLAWEQGKGDDWQAVLWRALVDQAPDSMHTAALARQFLRRINRSSGPIQGFPHRVSLFGISALPPLYLGILSALGTRVAVHLFVLSPSREYWGDIRSSRDKLRARFGDGVSSVELGDELAQPEGNPLLASMGRLHGDFQQVLELTDDYVEPDDDLYREAPSTGTMLWTLQADILALRYRHCDNPEAPPRELQSDDSSISVHSCHGPMREIEVLHDQLLALFEADLDLQARDVVVMMPDLEQYAPLIDAVFGGESRDRPHIPYRVADRSTRTSDEVVDAFSRILSVLSGRFAAPELLDLLAIDRVRERFGISADELGPIRTWVAETGIRWGLDREHRVSLGQPPYQENTWRFGLDRLLLGYAMPGPELFGGVLPYDEIEGSETALLGRFVEYCETLFEARKTLQKPRTVGDWQFELEGLLAAAVAATDANAAAHQSLRDSLAQLAGHAAAAGFEDEVPLESIRSLLEAQWLRAGSGRGFLSGGVTFCQLKPQRSIPFRVVCLLGMSDGAFPRSPQAMGFDLAAASPRIGDQAPRDDDRYLFLEALLSAGEKLVITYVGQDIQNNRALPPSVVLGELLDTLEESFCLPAASEGPTLRERIVLQHPLQPFSPRHFSASADPQLFSYSAAYCDAARSLTRPRSRPRRFLNGALLPRAGDPRVVTVDQLAGYFMRPARSFTERRVGLRLREDDDGIGDREPITLQGLEAWRLGDQLLERALAGDSLEHALPWVRGAGAIPLGTVGEIEVSDTSRTALAIAGVAHSWREGVMLDGLAVDRELEQTRVIGSLDEIWPKAHVKAGFARLLGSSELSLWVRHLLLCWVAPQDYPRSSVAVGRAESGRAAAAMRFAPVQDPQSHLRVLLRLFWLGQLAPLPLFPRAARLYAQRLADPASPEIDPEALATARTAFTNQHGAEGEAFGPYVKQLFGDADPLAGDYRPFEDLPEGFPSFPEVARAIFVPLLAHREVVEP